MKLLFATLAVLSFLSFSLPAALADQDILNRDNLPTAARVASNQDVARMKAWLDRAGVNTQDDSVVYNLLHFGVGVNYPMSDDLNLTVSGGSKLRFGVAF